MSDGKHDFKPAKGFFGDLTEDSLNFLQGALEDIWNAAGDKGELNDLIDEERGEEFIKNLLGSAQGWREERDAFGIKAYKDLAWTAQANGTPQKYRVTVVWQPKRGTMHIDVRVWAAY
jgi:hypothetical protein